MAKLWGAEERRPRSRADCLLWALLGFFLLVEGLVLSTAFLPSFDSAAQQQEQEQQWAQHPAPTPLPATAADRQALNPARPRPRPSPAAVRTAREARTEGPPPPLPSCTSAVAGCSLEA